MFVEESCSAGGGGRGRGVGGGWAGDEGYGFEGGGGGLLEEFVEDGGAEGASRAEDCDGFEFHYFVLFLICVVIVGINGGVGG